MLRVDLASPMLGLVVGRKGLLSRKDKRIWNRDSGLRAAATALAIEKYETENATILNNLNEDEESGLIRFLNWLIEHQDEIRALIEMIMSLFSDTEGKYVL